MHCISKMEVEGKVSRGHRGEIRGKVKEMNEKERRKRIQCYTKNKATERTASQKDRTKHIQLGCCLGAGRPGFASHHH